MNSDGKNGDFHGFVAQGVTLNQSMLAVNRSYRYVHFMIDVYKLIIRVR